MCAACKERGLPTLKNLTKSLDDMRTDTMARLDTVERSMSDMNTTMDTAIANKLRAELPAIVREIGDSVSKKVAIEVRKEIPNITREVESSVSGKIKEEVQKAIRDQNRQDITAAVRKAVDQEVTKLKENAPQNIPAAAQAAPPVSPGTHMKQTVANVSAEIKDREGRRRNIIIHKVKEPNTNVKTERSEADIQFVIDLAKDISVTLNRGDFVDAVRLGKRSEVDRPLLVTMFREEKKSDIFRNLAKLRNTKFKDISINHDMTKLEREQNKKLVAEAKDMASNDKSGLWYYRVRGPPWERKIVQVPRQQEPRRGTPPPPPPPAKDSVGAKE